MFKIEYKFQGRGPWRIAHWDETVLSSHYQLGRQGCYGNPILDLETAQRILNKIISLFPKTETQFRIVKCPNVETP